MAATYGDVADYQRDADNEELSDDDSDPGLGPDESLGKKLSFFFDLLVATALIHVNWHGAAGSRFPTCPVASEAMAGAWPGRNQAWVVAPSHGGTRAAFPKRLASFSRRGRGAAVFVSGRIKKAKRLCFGKAEIVGLQRHSSCVAASHPCRKPGWTKSSPKSCS